VETKVNFVRKTDRIDVSKNQSMFLENVINRIIFKVILKIILYTNYIIDAKINK
jgi:hypothetical protein